MIGEYILSEGYMYFNNTAIKIRYDLIAKIHNLNEESVFDRFDNIFSLKPGERVDSKTPMETVRAHRLAFIITDKTNFTASKVKCMPFLHDKSIYLNRIKSNTN